MRCLVKKHGRLLDCTLTAGAAAVWPQGADPPPPPPLSATGSTPFCGPPL